MLKPDFSKLTKIQWGKAWFSKKYPEYYKYVVEKYKHEWKVSLYMDIHNMDRIPTCPVCGKPLKFRDMGVGFSEYCSYSCSSKAKVHPKWTKESRERRERTNLKKYGAKWSIQSQQIKDKIKQTNLERYGEEIPSKSKEIKDKIKQTNLERYGGLGLGSDKLKAKIQQTNLDKYGSVSPFGDENVKHKSIMKRQSQYINERSFQLGYTNDGKLICKCPHPECDKCEEKTYIISNRMYYDRQKDNTEPCTNLLPVQPLYSTLELKIRSWLDEMGIEYIANDRRFGMEMDVYIPSLQLAIEVNGSYWHSTQFKSPSYHIQKSILLAEKGVRVVFVWDDYLEDDIKEFLIAAIKEEELNPWVDKWFPDIDGWPADFGLIGSDWKEHKTIHGGFECYDAGIIKKEDL